MAQFTRSVWDSDEKGRLENARLRNQINGPKRREVRPKGATRCPVPDELYALGQFQFRGCSHKKPDYGMRGKLTEAGLCLGPQRRDAKEGEPSSRSCRDIMRDLCRDDEMDEYARQVATLGEEELQKYQKKLSYKLFMRMLANKSSKTWDDGTFIKFVTNLSRQFPPPGSPNFRELPEYVHMLLRHAAHTHHPEKHEVFNEAKGGYEVYHDVFSAWECEAMRGIVPADESPEWHKLFNKRNGMSNFRQQARFPGKHYTVIKERISQLMPEGYVFPPDKTFAYVIRNNYSDLGPQDNKDEQPMHYDFDTGLRRLSVLISLSDDVYLVVGDRSGKTKAARAKPMCRPRLPRGSVIVFDNTVPHAGMGDVGVPGCERIHIYVGFDCTPEEVHPRDEKGALSTFYVEEEDTPRV